VAFIRKRLSSIRANRYGTEEKFYSYQLIETYREGGKVKHRVLVNLRGAETIAEALKYARLRLEDARKDVKRNAPLSGWAGGDNRRHRWAWLKPEEQERRKASFREGLIADVAKCEARVALLESLLSKEPPTKPSEPDCSATEEECADTDCSVTEEEYGATLTLQEESECEWEER
jgi:hypothetical protein